MLLALQEREVKLIKLKLKLILCCRCNMLLSLQEPRVILQ